MSIENAKWIQSSNCQLMDEKFQGSGTYLLTFDCELAIFEPLPSFLLFLELLIYKYLNSSNFLINC